MIWRIIQVIGGVLFVIGIIALTQGKQYASSIVALGFLSFAFGWVMRFITRN